MKSELKERVELLKSQIHTLLDTFYDETGWLPITQIDVKEVELKGKNTVLASQIEIYLN